MSTYFSSSNSKSRATSKKEEDKLRLPKSWKESYAENVGYLWCPTKVDILEQPPSPLKFYREYVATSRPCIIRNAILDPLTCHPLELTLDDIMEKLDPDSTRLTVDVTPDGHGDCVRKVVMDYESCSDKSQTTTTSTLMFVQPKEVRISLREFHRRLRHQEAKAQCRNVQVPSNPCIRSHQESSESLASPSMEYDVNHLPSIPFLAEHPSSGLLHIDDDPSVVSLPDDSIVYYSRQNDCLRSPEEDSSSNGTTCTGITDLASLFPSGFEWASFGTPLEAVNLWMGNACSVSSMHKDHYENLFYVASGEKIFTVCPPADAPFLYQQMEYPSGQFNYCCDSVDNDPTTFTAIQSGRWTVQPLRPMESSSCCSAPIADNPLASTTMMTTTSSESTTKVRWIYPDLAPLASSISHPLPSPPPQQRQQQRLLLEEFPLLRHTHPMEIHVQAGEMLYLPSLWFHRVTQSCETIGVNYWYDMRFDGNPQWCYFSLLQELELIERRDHDDDVDDDNNNNKTSDNQIP